MMKIGVIGGRLQGTEAAYLAKQAGFEVLLIDRDSQVPASTLADEFVTLDIVDDFHRAGELLRSVDMIIPANENLLAISKAYQLARAIDRPYVYDPRAYAVSSSKLTSDALFSLIGIPHPAPWPHSSFPVVVKPSNMSGSAGVLKISSEKELRKYLLKNPCPGKLVVQEFIAGPSLSLEVIALNGKARTLQVTELKFDRNYDCKRVIAGKNISPVIEAKLREIACRLAESLSLTGIMDIEVMVDGSIPKVIEIDARLPSQTPTAVFHSTGLNMVEALTDVFVRGHLPQPPNHAQRAVIYEHAAISGTTLEITGEHVMASAGSLACTDNRYGFDRVVSDYDKNGDRSWSATLITSGNNYHEAVVKRHQALKRLMAEHNLTTLVDPSPGGPENAKEQVIGVMAQ